MDSTALSTRNLDHLGIVAGICDKIELVETINLCIEPNERLISVGEATKALILNALGFVSRPLYLTPEFFQNKPVDLLLGEHITPQQLNDDSLGRALDSLYQSGLSEIFAVTASQALLHFGIKFKGAHLDSTSVSFQGAYLNSFPQDDSLEDNELQPIHITYGHSKDKRPDLKQAVFSLICAHESTIPLWIEALSGNTSDKTSFPKTIHSYLEQLSESEQKEMFFIVDSALYSEDNLKTLLGIYWITRVPETITLAKKAIEETSQEECNSSLGENYFFKEIESDYAGIKQRWLVVFSKAAFERENKTFEKELSKDREKHEKALKKLAKKEFKSKEEALEELKKCSSGWKYFKSEKGEFKKKESYVKAGRPAAGEAKAVKVSYSIVGKIEESNEAIEKKRKKLGKFIVATNIEETEMSGEEVLENYKKQGATVERGFRFLKDPMFFASSLFLKKPERIMALLMIMGLSLLIYSLAEHQLQTQMKKQKKTLPDQKGKEVEKISIRRVFQIFEGIHEATLGKKNSVQRFILNIKPIHHRVLSLFGEDVRKYYIFDT